jgi:hypothetical protein
MSGFRVFRRSTNIFVAGLVVSLILFYAFHEDSPKTPKFLSTPFRTVTKTVTRTVSITNVLTPVAASPKKPRIGKHTYRPDGLLEVNENGPHPIFELVREAERNWKEKLRRASKTLVEAVREYRRRYKRDPPKGFDLWYVIHRVVLHFS